MSVYVCGFVLVYVIYVCGGLKSLPTLWMNTANICMPWGVSISTFHITMSLHVSSFSNSHVLQKMYILYLPYYLSSHVFKETIQIRAKYSTGEIYFTSCFPTLIAISLSCWTAENRGNEPHFLHKIPKTFNVCTSSYTLCRPPILRIKASTSPFSSKLFPRYHLKWLFTFDMNTHMHFHYSHSHTPFLLSCYQSSSHTYKTECWYKKQRHSHTMCKRKKKSEKEWKKQALAKDINTWCVEKYKKRMSTSKTWTRNAFSCMLYKRTTYSTHTHTVFIWM